VEARYPMSELLWLISSLASLVFGVFCLLLGYRWIGRPEGADPRYDARYRQWGGIYKVLGWGWVVIALLGLWGKIAGLLGYPGW
jgi:hypothetical protein